MEPKILKEMPDRYPTNGTFELTVRCNLHCKMCLFRHDDSENADLIKNEMTAHEWIDMARQVAEAGTMNLLITGGEPMLRPDFCEIWEGIYKQGFMIELYTNATLVTPQIMEILRKYPPHKIGVTIYGASKETYEKVCGNGEAYYAMLRGIEFLQELPSIITYRTTVIKDNFNDVVLMEQMVKKKFKSEAELIESRIVTSSVRGACSDVSACRLDAKKNIELLLHRGIEKAEKKVVSEGNIPVGFKVQIHSKVSKNANGKVRLSLLGCDAGMTSYTISWNGELLACQLLGQFYINIRKFGFKKGWKELVFLIKVPELNEDCKECEYYSICEACPATRYAETGDMGGKVPYLCEDTNELMKYVRK